jgi:Transposase, Mutator family
MTATLPDVAAKKNKNEESAEQQIAVELVRQARERGLSLTGPGGLLKQLTKTVIEAALQEELTEHLGYEKHDPAGAGTGNTRNGMRSKTVLTDASGEVEIGVPRDRAGIFEPVIVKKRQRRLEGVDQVVLSLYAKGLTTGEISAHFEEIYGASVSKETISRITDRVLDEMADWATRPLDEIYAAVFVDAIVVKVRDGQVTNRPFYAAIGVTLDGERDILGLWAGSGGEGAKFWMSPHRLAQPRRQGHLLPRLRRAEGPSRGRGQRVAGDHRANVSGPPAAQHLPAGLQTGLGCPEEARDADLYRGQRRRGAGRLEDLVEHWKGATRRSSGCGTTRGTPSSPSSTTTSRYAVCSRPRTASRA